jgi:hypothetical protein
MAVAVRAFGLEVYVVNGVFLDEVAKVLGVHGLVFDQVFRELLEEVPVAEENVFGGVV